MSATEPPMTVKEFKEGYQLFGKEQLIGFLIEKIGACSCIASFCTLNILPFLGQVLRYIKFRLLVIMLLFVVLSNTF
jgi:hypothetical protein